MWLVWAENERVPRHNFRLAVFVANSAFSGNYQIQLPLGRVRVVSEIAFSCRHPVPFQIKWVPLGQVERSGLASQRFRNSFEGDGVFSARRLPRLLFVSFQPLFSGQYKGNRILKTGAPERIRTTNLLIRSQMLYPVELRAPVKSG